MLRALPIGRRYSLEAVAYDFFLSRLGSRVHTEAHVAALAAALLRQKEQSGRAHLVTLLLGLSEGSAAPPGAVVEGLVEFYAQLHAVCGPLVGEASEVGGQVGGWRLCKWKLVQTGGIGSASNNRVHSQHQPCF